MNDSTAIDFDLVEDVLTSPRALALTVGAETHGPALRLIGHLVRHTTDEAFIVDVVRSLLPVDYSGNTLDEVPRMIADAIKKGFDKPGVRTKKANAKVSEVVLRLIEGAGVRLFHTEQHEAYISLPLPGTGTHSFPVDSERTRNWARLLYFRDRNRAIAETALTEVVGLLKAKAMFDGPLLPVNLRIGGIDDRVFIDLGDDSGEYVCITPDGWSLTMDCPLMFYRSSGFGALPRPERDGDLLALKVLLGLDDRNWVLLLGFIINCLKPNGPYMFLLVEGEQGSGKSQLCTTVRKLVDPNAIDKLRLPKTEHDLMIQASENAVLVFDNASGMRGEMSDALCSLATGGGFSTRRYYTDNESRTFKHCRPVIINGIGEFANRPDLLERSIQLRLSSMPVDARKTELALNAQLREILPGVLGCLFDIVATALGRLGEVPAPTTVRMADAAQWLVAAEPATGLPEGTLLRALVEAQTEMMIEKAMHDQVVLAILHQVQREQGLHKVKNGIYETTIGKLHTDLMAQLDRRTRHFPPTPQHLSTEIRRLAPAMAKLGIGVEFGKRTREGRTILLRVEGDIPPIEPWSGEKNWY